jgi:hypothetical protein
MKARDAVAMASKSLTPQRLREMLEYDAETGQFRWRVARGERGQQGRVQQASQSRQHYDRTSPL